MDPVPAHPIVQSLDLIVDGSMSTRIGLLKDEGSVRVSRHLLLRNQKSELTDSLRNTLIQFAAKKVFHNLAIAKQSKGVT